MPSTLPHCRCCSGYTFEVGWVTNPSLSVITYGRLFGRPSGRQASIFSRRRFSLSYSWSEITAQLAGNTAHHVGQFLAEVPLFVAPLARQTSYLFESIFLPVGKSGNSRNFRCGGSISHRAMLLGCTQSVGNPVYPVAHASRHEILMIFIRCSINWKRL